MRSLQLHWQRHVDRFLHTVASRQDGAMVDWLVSLPGMDLPPPNRGQLGVDGVAEWPNDPPLQHVEHPTQHLALGVGMAGKNHWSVSFEQEEDRVVFDVACRVHEAVPLGAVYRTLQPDLQWCIAGSDARGVSAEGGIVLHCEGGSWAIRDDYLLLCIPAPEGPLPATVRWRYAVRAISTDIPTPESL